MIVRVEYPELSAAEGVEIVDDIEAEDLGTNLAELKQHARNMPLAPGDVVTHHDGVVTSVVQYALTWLIEVEFKLPANLTFMQALPSNDKAIVKIEATVAGWQRDAYVTKHSGFTYLVSAPDRDWIKDKVQSSPYVDHMELVRYPDMPIIWEIARRNASLETLSAGPWA